MNMNFVPARKYYSNVSHPALFFCGHLSAQNGLMARGKLMPV